ncbi:MAG TPA: DUF4230 domain-containing protein [Roseiflexaceae bacterium]|nr:DUF4230 domain-containing protein [Roseiflexaceae bacterium]
MARYEDDPAREDGDDRPPRETLIQRRMRAARGEEVDDPLDDEEDYPAWRARRAHAPYPPAYLTGGGCAQTALYLTLGAITLVLLFMLFGRQVVESVTGSIAQSVPERVRQVVATPTPTIRDRGGTIQQIRSLNRLETQQYSVERIIEANVERGNLLDLFLGERLLLIASGDVVAGVDLSKLHEDDVQISADGETITLRLPPSEILSARLDNDRTRVYDRQTRVGTQILGGQDKDLETQARQEAERQILEAACEDGVMQKAADEARRAMEQFLRLLEFENVTVIATPGECVKPEAS